MAEKAIERGKPADAAILKKVIEVIDVDNDIEVMKKYYSTAEAWEKHRRLYEEGPSREWQELYRDVTPCSERTQPHQRHRYWRIAG